MMSKKRESFKKSDDNHVMTNLDHKSDDVVGVPEEIKRVSNLLRNSKFKEDLLTSEELEDMDKAILSNKANSHSRNS